MRKRPPDQPSLFDDSPEPPNPVIIPQGDHHAVQDHSPRTTPGTDGATRTVTPHPPTPADNGDLRSRTEGQPRDVEGDTGGSEAGQRSEPDLLGSPGIGHPGTGGSFAVRVSGGRQGAILPRSGNGVHPKSYAEKVKASRQATLF